MNTNAFGLSIIVVSGPHFHMLCEVIGIDVLLLGIVPPNREESDEDKVLKGVVRVEMVQNPADYIPTILTR